MSSPSTTSTLHQLIAGWENECVEFKEANDNFSTSDIGKYFSALSNEANLRSRPAAWLVFGVRDRDHAIDDDYYCKLILHYLAEFGSGKRADFERLLENKLSDALSLKQKERKIGNLLQSLRRQGKIHTDGITNSAVRKLCPATPVVVNPSQS